MRHMTTLARTGFILFALLIGASRPAAAQDPFIGEIRWVPYDFAPRGWAFCDGQLLSIAQNTALFSLLGTTFGGNGQTTFALPDMRGRMPMHAGQGIGLTTRTLGEMGGAETHSLSVSEMPAHDHQIGSHAHSIPALDVALGASSAAATSVDPTGNVLATAVVSGQGNAKATKIYAPGPANVSLGVTGATNASTTGSASGTTSSVGGTQPHSTISPYLGIHCIIALQGIYPSRN